METKMYETSDIALSSYLYCCGTLLLSINHDNPHRCIFVFESPNPELISKWQEGKANVNGLAFYNALQTLKRKIFRGTDD